MDLFNQTDETYNLLPKDGNALYHGFIFSREEANSLFDTLMKSIAWRNDEVVMYGKHIVTKRKVAWYGDNLEGYSYPNVIKDALPFTDELNIVKKKIEEITGEKYNACLLNLYHDGSESLSWHNDNEPCFKKHAAIASVSIGATRKFAFKHIATKEVISLILESGSLLVMKDETQSHWLHSLPSTTKVTKPRINLTFRTIVR